MEYFLFPGYAHIDVAGVGNTKPTSVQGVKNNTATKRSSRSIRPGL